MNCFTKIHVYVIFNVFLLILYFIPYDGLSWINADQELLELNKGEGKCFKLKLKMY